MNTSYPVASSQIFSSYASTIRLDHLHTNCLFFRAPFPHCWIWQDKSLRPPRCSNSRSPAFKPLAARLKQLSRPRRVSRMQLRFKGLTLLPPVMVSSGRMPTWTPVRPQNGLGPGSTTSHCGTRSTLLRGPGPLLRLSWVWMSIGGRPCWHVLLAPSLVEWLSRSTHVNHQCTILDFLHSKGCLLVSLSKTLFICFSDRLT